MRSLFLLALWSIALISAVAGEELAFESLVGREFAVDDDWAGQELAFVRKGDSILAVWRVLGSGRPVLSEVESPIEAKSPRQCVFAVQLRDGSRSKVKIEISDRSEVQAYLNGVKFPLKEKNPNKAVDSTATRVTPPAEQESRHGQP
jgi:hypothetical protein